jgi:hypothetical protein
VSPAEALARRARADGLVPVGVISSYNRDSRGVLWLRGSDMAHLPDLEDPATVAVFEAIAGELFGPVFHVAPSSHFLTTGTWHAWAYIGDEAKRVAEAAGWDARRLAHFKDVGRGASRAEALIAALEAAPVRS